MDLTITPGEPIVVPIRVFGRSGAREMDALLDTGASFLTIPPEDAIDLGYSLEESPRVSLATAKGTIEAPKVVLSHVTLGPYDARAVPAICLDIAGAGVSSLLGLSLLARFNIALQSKAGTLTITDP